MPPASAVNNNANNAAVQAAKAERAEKLRGALRGFIIDERHRRQEYEAEYEAQCEQLRLQREREARERENTLTLEDTRGQITRLDEQLADLQSQKHQLVVQLKKVLNDDETRKKQMKDSELFAIQQAMQQATAVSVAAQVYMPPVRLQQHSVPMLQKAPPASHSTKRGRSPSPPNQHQAYYKNAASYAPQKSTAPYPGTGTLFYQTTAAPPTTQHQADARLSSIYSNYSLPLRPAYHMELQHGPTATVSKPPDAQSKGQPMQVLHINLDQPPISQADLVVQATGTSSLSVQTSKPQVTMEKLPERYHIEGKHDGGAPPGHVPPPPHLLSEGGVIYKPLLGELSLHPNVLQISSNSATNPKTTGSITQGYAPGRGGSAHEQQLARQQLSLLPGQPTSSGPSQPPGQQIHFTRRLY
ncbi:trithorax group protein osa isoform X2 [Scaptodrosophila lebanonensis]|uniref:Trithorax group protein osa isoform X2 n=1 Tax=Drosophila lebanonensis TaxID=7225 RepID=A0A6J2U8N2_DROLE|nr:trithorax group protein osa isoform X2 [Scaptodrosophila lebanonensis]